MFAPSPSDFRGNFEELRVACLLKNLTVKFSHYFSRNKKSLKNEREIPSGWRNRNRIKLPHRLPSHNPKIKFNFCQQKKRSHERITATKEFPQKSS